MEKAFIFDRDGTLIEDRHYISSPFFVRLMPGVRERLINLYESGNRLFIVSNQSGIRRGYFSYDRLMEIDRRMKELLYPVRFEETFYCIHHPSERCPCRKPAPYFIWKIKGKYKLKREEMVFVGNSRVDEETASNAGIRFVHIRDFLRSF